MLAISLTIQHINYPHLGVLQWIKTESCL